MRRESDTRYEHPDPTPVEVPFGFTYESLAETISRMVQIENLKTEAKKEYVESFAESQDFDEDPDEIQSRHEMTEMQEEMDIASFEELAQPSQPNDPVGKDLPHQPTEPAPDVAPNPAPIDPKPITPS